MMPFFNDAKWTLDSPGELNNIKIWEKLNASNSCI